MTDTRRGPAAPLLLLLLIFLSGCARPVEAEHGMTSALLITDVGYGDAADIDGAGQPLPQYVEITNTGARDVDLSDCYLSDGGQWSEDGLARLPRGASLRPGASMVVASYGSAEESGGDAPVDFAQIYGFRPDYEIAGRDPAVPDAAGVRGRIRLHHGACDTDASCRAAFEEILLIDGTDLTDEDVVTLLEQEALAGEVLARFPWAR